MRGCSTILLVGALLPLIFAANAAPVRFPKQRVFEAEFQHFNHTSHLFGDSNAVCQSSWVAGNTNGTLAVLYNGSSWRRMIFSTALPMLVVKEKAADSFAIGAESKNDWFRWREGAWKSEDGGDGKKLYSNPGGVCESSFGCPWGYYDGDDQPSETGNWLYITTGLFNMTGNVTQLHIGWRAYNSSDPTDVKSSYIMCQRNVTEAPIHCDNTTMPSCIQTYRSFATSTKVWHFHEAYQACESDGGWLASVRKSAAWDRLRDLGNVLDTDYEYWLGASNALHPHEYRWVGGGPASLDFDDGVGEVVVNSTKTPCIAASFCPWTVPESSFFQPYKGVKLRKGALWGWDVDDLSGVQQGFICEYGEIEDEPADQYEFKLVTTTESMNFSAARDACNERGMWLATPRTTQQLAALRTAMGVDSTVFVGLERDGSVIRHADGPWRHRPYFYSDKDTCMVWGSNVPSDCNISTAGVGNAAFWSGSRIEFTSSHITGSKFMCQKRIRTNTHSLSPTPSVSPLNTASETPTSTTSNSSTATVPPTSSRSNRSTATPTRSIISTPTQSVLRSPTRSIIKTGTPTRIMVADNTTNSTSHSNLTTRSHTSTPSRSNPATSSKSHTATPAITATYFGNSRSKSGETISPTVSVAHTTSITPVEEVRKKEPEVALLLEPEAIEAATAVGMASASASSAASAGAASQVARAQSTLELAAMCGTSTGREMGKALPFAVSPTRMTVGSDGARYYRGASVGNAILIVTLALLLVLSSAAIGWSQKEDSSQGLLVAVLKGMAKLRFPSSLFFPVMILQDGLVSGAATAVMRGEPSFRAWDITWLILLLFLLLSAVVWTLLVTHFRRGLFWNRIRYVQSPVGSEQQTQASIVEEQPQVAPKKRLKQSVRHWLWPQGSWAAKEDATATAMLTNGVASTLEDDAASRHAVLFGRYHAGATSFLVIDCSSAFVSSLLRGLTDARLSSHCKRTAWLTLVVNAGFFVYAAWQRPYATPAKNVILVVMAAVTAHAALLVALASLSSPWDVVMLEWAAAAAGMAIYISMGAFFVFILQRYRSWKLRRRMAVNALENREELRIRLLDAADVDPQQPRAPPTEEQLDDDILAVLEVPSPDDPDTKPQQRQEQQIQDVTIELDEFELNDPSTSGDKINDAFDFILMPMDQERNGQAQDEDIEVDPLLLAAAEAQRQLRQEIVVGLQKGKAVVVDEQPTILDEQQL